MVTMTPIFFTSSNLTPAFLSLSMLIGLWARFSTLNESNLSLFLTITSNMPSVNSLLAALTLLTPCRNYVILSNP